jgi:hypothetical protein
MLRTKFATFGAAAALALILGFAASAPASAQSIAKQCGNDWKAAKAAGTTNGQTWSEFYKSCKAQKEAGTTAAPAATPMATPAAAPAAAPAPVATTAPKPKRTPAVATGEGEFANESEAKAHCPSDTVVWLNTKSHKYHFTGNRSYGTTKKGAYMCEADAKAGGGVAAKGEKPK